MSEEAQMSSPEDHGRQLKWMILNSFIGEEKRRHDMEPGQEEAELEAQNQETTSWM